MPLKLVEKDVGFQNFHGEVGPPREGVLRKAGVVVVVLQAEVLLLQVVVVVLQAVVLLL